MIRVYGRRHFEYAATHARKAPLRFPHARHEFEVQLFSAHASASRDTPSSFRVSRLRHWPGIADDASHAKAARASFFDEIDARRPPADSQGARGHFDFRAASFCQRLKRLGRARRGRGLARAHASSLRIGASISAKYIECRHYIAVLSCLCWLYAAQPIHRLILHSHAPDAEGGASISRWSYRALGAEQASGDMASPPAAPAARCAFHELAASAT